VFSVHDRDRARDHVLGLAETDGRVVAAAVVGGFADGAGDRWSDLDLTFAVDDGVDVAEVLEDWTQAVAAGLDAVHLFDLQAGAAIYRVFLLPGCLQVDLSFAPASAFGARGLRARFSIERGRSWQAEHWISGVRDQALLLACRRRGLDGSYGRRFDELPPDLLAACEPALVRSLQREELLRALAGAISVLQQESEEAAELAAAVAPQLQALASGSQPSR
jgi:hypothetical protein